MDSDIDETQDFLLLDKQLCFPLYAASRLVTRLYQPLLAPLGITYTQYIILMILWQDAPCTISHIGKRALLNSNTLTPLLKRLEQEGFITRTRAQNDERIVNIALTPKGSTLKEKCSCIPHEMLKSIQITQDEYLSLKSTLDKLIIRLSDE